jgi:hypothetical protein
LGLLVEAMVPGCTPAAGLDTVVPGIMEETAQGCTPGARPLPSSAMFMAEMAQGYALAVSTPSSVSWRK